MRMVPALPALRRAASAFTLLLAAAGLVGCAQHDCHTSCSKLFGDGDGECAIQVPGHADANGQAEIEQQCEGYCDAAMNQSGAVGDYDPNVRASGNEDVGLENDAQAALWMDCIDDTDCADLNNNYCAPTTNFGN